jgi:hypothetical protein
VIWMVLPAILNISYGHNCVKTFRSLQTKLQGQKRALNNKYIKWPISHTGLHTKKTS